MQSIRRTRSFFTPFWTLAACVTLFASTAPAQVKDFDSIKLYTLENDSGMPGMKIFYSDSGNDSDSSKINSDPEEIYSDSEHFDSGPLGIDPDSIPILQNQNQSSPPPPLTLPPTFCGWLCFSG